MYKTKLAKEEENIRNFGTALKELKPKFIELGFDGIFPIIQSRLNDPTYSLLTPSGKRIPFPDYYLITKGVAVRNAIYTIYKDYKPTKEDVVIEIDGDGQIPYDTILDLILLLKEHEYVISCRGNKSGMEDSERIKIEHFENFLITNKFGYPSLPDAQCGCLAFKGNYIEGLDNHLRAYSFEIELDILGYFLNKGIIPCINHVKIRDDLSTTWDNKENKNKILSLTNQYGFDQRYLLNMFQKFVQQFKTKLPYDYIANLTLDEIPKNKNVTIEKPKNINYPLKNCSCNKSNLPSSNICKIKN